jgi:hypothetical protein
MKSTFCLVYQAGIANVFEEIPVRDTRSQASTGLTIRSDRVRVLQSDFRACESFCRGLKRAKKTVRVAWCNEAGDIQESFWRFSDFSSAPFSDKFAKDFIDINR